MSLAARWVRFSDHHHRLVLTLCALVAAAGALGTVRLYSDLRPDLSELLPARSRSALDMAAVNARMGGFAEESVVLSGADPVTLEVFADDLVEKLGSAPPGLIRTIESRVDPVRDFFLPRLLFFPTVPQLARLRDTLAARIAWEKERAPPRKKPRPRRRDPAAEMPRKPAPDVEGLVEELAGQGGALVRRFPEGYVMGEVPGRKPGEKLMALAVVVRLAGSPDDYGRVKLLDRTVREAVASLEPHKADPRLEVGYGGYVASSIHEHEALAEDLVWATVLVLLAVAAAVAIYNRTWKAVLAVGIRSSLGRSPPSGWRTSWWVTSIPTPPSSGPSWWATASTWG